MSKTQRKKAADLPMNTVYKRKHIVLRKKGQGGKYRHVWSKVPSKDHYLTHDNGAQPFYVEIEKTKVKIFSQSSNDLDNSDYVIYDNLVVNTKYKRILPARGLICDGGKKKFDSNFNGHTVLVDIGNNIYLYIGENITIFQTKEEIVKFVGCVGRSNVPYCWFITDNHCGLFSDVNTKKRTYSMVPNTLVDLKYPYLRFWNYDRQGEIDARSITKQKFKILVERF
jgi:hypothetical protein